MVTFNIIMQLNKDDNIHKKQITKNTEWTNGQSEFKSKSRNKNKCYFKYEQHTDVPSKLYKCPLVRGIFTNKISCKS